MNMSKILYVEDSPMDVDLTMQAFKENKIANQVVVTNDGVEALEYLKLEGRFKDRKEGNPSFILLDLKMPRMDGMEFLAIIKKDARFKRIPVIMLTSSREEKDLIRGYDLGVNAYVVKPLDFSALTQVVKQIEAFWVITNETPPE